LGSHDIEFRPRTAIKTQALVDFVSEWTEQQVPDNPETAEVWRMYFDGSLKLQGAGAGILFTAPGGEHLKYALQLLFPASNNAAEYEALIHGLNIAMTLGVKRLMVYGDSLVVISQINKEWDCSSDSMGKYCAAVRKLEDKFEGLEFHHIERDRNTAADVLSKLGSGRTQVPPGVFVQEILQPSISMDQTEECNIINQLKSDSDDWRRPIIKYIKNEEEPDDKNSAERIARQSAHYTLIGGGIVQEGRVRRPHEVRSPVHRKATSGGSPCRALWNTCSIQNTSREGLQVRILLADGEERCSRVSSKMRSLPIPVKATAHANTAATDHTSNLAFRMLGTGYDWTFQESSRRIYPCIGGD
jgi:ribonuclease HI